MKRSFDFESDVLVIGGGLAGLVAAITAARQQKVLLLSKSARSQSSSAWAQGGIAAALSPEDSPKIHLEDTLQVGCGLADERAAEILVNSAPHAIELLTSLGVPFERNADETLNLGREGGHSRRRIVHARGGSTGEAIMSALYGQIEKNFNIKFVESLEIVQLLKDGERCIGALAYDSHNGHELLIAAGAVILATGGAADLYEQTTNPSTSNGSGIALAYEAGAKIQDIEFIQFHPTALSDGSGRALLISEAVRGEGALLLNAKGKRFMPELHELAELAPRDLVARAIGREIERTGGVFLSLRALQPDFVNEKFYSLVRACKERGFDLARDLIPVAPAAHYTIGGVRTDLWGATSVPGLYACGEVACTGLHGANRLASNSLLECVVFGERAGQSAAQMTKNKNIFNWVDGNVSAERTNFDGANLLQIESSLKRVMTRDVGLNRTQAGLQSALAQIERFLIDLELEPPSVAVARLKRRLQVAALITQAALARKETRGTHARLDFPDQDPRWQRHIILQKETELCSIH